MERTYRIPPPYRAAVQVINARCRTVLDAAGISADDLLARHARGDGGSLDGDMDLYLRNAREADLPHGATLSCFPVTVDVWVTSQGNYTMMFAGAPDGTAKAARPCAKAPREVMIQRENAPYAKEEISKE